MSLFSKQKTRWGEIEVYTQQPPFPIIQLNQTHSDLFHPAQIDSQGLEGDGFICQLTGCDQAFALRTADCIPALIEGDFGWALAHLGWKGLAQKMIQKEEVQRLRPTHLWIGPHICGKHYEVQEEFTKNFPQSHNFFEKEGKLFFDLQNELLDQCKIFGDLKVSASSACTFDSDVLQSFRRDQNQLRNWTVFKSS